MVRRSFLNFTVLVGLATLGFCATYDNVGDVPHIDWDFIIIGGTHHL